MTDKLYVYSQSVKDVLQEDHLRAESVEHVHRSIMRSHEYLVRYRSEVVAGVAWALDVGYDSLSAAAEILKSLTELFDLGCSAADSVRFHVDELDSRVCSSCIDGIDGAVDTYRGN